MRQKLDEAISDYKHFRKSGGIALGTLRNESVVLNRFLSNTGNIWVHNLESHHVTRHFEDAARTKSARSLRNDYTMLSVFFQWCRATKRMPIASDPMYGRRKPVAIIPERQRLHVSKFPALLDAAEKREPRNRAAVAVLLYTLLRDREAALLRVSDVDLDAGYIHVRVWKTHEEDLVPISSELDVELRKWLTHYTTSLGRELLPEDYLLPARGVKTIRGERGRIVGRETVSYKPTIPIPRLFTIVNPCLEDIGFAVVGPDGKRKFEGAHTLRRSGARALFDALLDSGYDYALRVVQTMLHHKQMATTEVYIGISADRRSRDDLLKGKPMYGLPEVARLGVVRGNKDEDRLVV